MADLREELTMPTGNSRRGRLSRAKIIDSALELAEETGVDSLSLHKLSARLGVSTMSLYNHIDDKNDLLDAMGDRLLTAIPLNDSAGKSWESVLRTSAHDFRSVVIEHPRAAPLLLTRRLNTPTLLPVVEMSLSMLADLGFDEAERVHVMRAFIAYLIGDLLRETGTTPSVASADTSLATSNEQALRDAGLPYVSASAPYLATCDHEAELDYGLELLISAIRHNIQNKE